MIWLFSRELQQVDVEVRRSIECDGYEIVVVFPDGTERVELVRDASRLIRRTRRLQRRLIRRGWQPRSPLGTHAMPSTRNGKLASLALVLSSVRRSVRRRVAAALATLTS